MHKQISILIIICFATLVASAQNEKYTAPVKWERYKVTDKDVSVLFPKLPVLIKNEDVCSETEKRQYAAYAENIVYGLNITFQTNRKAPDYCKQVGDLRKFDEKSFEDRLKELTTALKNAKTEKKAVNNLEIIKISDEFLAYWLINDFKNKRWFEVWTTDGDESNEKIENFVESVKIEKNPSGIEIEKGSSRTLGDEITADSNSSEETNSKQGEKTPLQKIRIILKERPNYTLEARQANLQGTVRLRVVFLANGGIGTIAPVSGLPYGLTEQAIAAALKIVFIPAIKNNIRVNISSLVEYSFSIY